jgi:penicillin-binding protein 2
MDYLDPFEKQANFKNTLKGKYSLDWVENSFCIGDDSQKSDLVSSGVSHLGSSFSNKKFFFIFLFIVIFFVIIFARLINLQVLKGDYYYNKAENNRQRILPIVAERGLIYDRDGRQLVQNIPNFSLAVIPQDLPKNEEELNKVISKLAQITDSDEEEIKNLIQKYKNYRMESIVIKENVEYEVALKIEVESVDLSGIYIQRGSKRLYLSSQDVLDIEDKNNYQKNNTLSHVLGYLGKLNESELAELYLQGYLPSDSIGKTGIEKIYEKYLRGIYGKKKIEVNALGKEQNILAEESPVPGDHIKLSINYQMQSDLENIIEKKLKEIGKERASAVVLDPNNGEILALVSYPGFDNNDFSGGISYEKYQNYLENKNKPLFNRAISGNFPAGSVIKPAIATAALEENIINSRSSFLSSGGIQVGDWFFPDWLAGGHGNTNVRQSIANSVNTFYYYIGGGYGNFKGLGIFKINEYLSLFGFSKKTDIDLPAENAGFIPTPEWKTRIKNERWYVGDTYNVSIGQGDLLVTPLQIASMTAIIANNGTYYKPHVLHSIINAKTNTEQIYEKEVVRKDFFDPYNLKLIRLGMEDCVDYGSCRLLKNLNFKTAGKTGTAQWSNNFNTHAWFTSFAPVEKPQIVVTIMVEEGGEGSAVAAPIAYEFYKTLKL